MSESTHTEETHAASETACPVRRAFDQGDYWKAHSMLDSASHENRAFLTKALAFDGVLIVVPTVLFGIWLAAALSF